MSAIADRMTRLRSRLFAPDVPEDVRDLVAELLDHAARLEGTLDLWEDAARARMRRPLDRAFHGRKDHR